MTDQRNQGMRITIKPSPTADTRTCDYIADCVMSGMARSGSVYDITLPQELLARAFANTTELLKAAVVVDRSEA